LHDPISKPDLYLRKPGLILASTGKVGMGIAQEVGTGIESVFS